MFDTAHDTPVPLGASCDGTNRGRATGVSHVFPFGGAEKRGPGVTRMRWHAVHPNGETMFDHVTVLPIDHKLHKLHFFDPQSTRDATHNLTIEPGHFFKRCHGWN